MQGRFGNNTRKQEIQNIAGTLVEIDTSMLRKDCLYSISGIRIDNSVVETVIDSVMDVYKRCNGICGRTVEQDIMECPYCGDTDFVDINTNEEYVMKELIGIRINKR